MSADRTAQLRLHPEDVVAIAEQVADRLAARPPQRLVDAATLAELLGVSPGFVRTHAEELGGLRIGSGPKARLRFDVDRAKGALAQASPAAANEGAAVRSPRQRQRRTGGVPLLPVKGRQAS